VDQQAYFNLISGREKGFCAGIFRFGLLVISQFYRCVIAVRNFLYDRGILPAHQADAVVISVGNITAGGTGKTPLVIWICDLLHSRGVQTAILTRGYKARKDNTSDEPAILAENCPHAKHIINPDRVTGARKAVSSFGAEVVVLDDGFQHRRLHRDVNIVTIDATRPFGFGRLLPRGLLREPPGQVRRAHAAVLTRCDQVSPEKLDDIESALRLRAPKIAVARTSHQPVGAKTSNGEDLDLDELKGKKAFAFCGIGNPEAFFKTLSSLGVEVAGEKVFDDHYKCTGDDLGQIYKAARNLAAEMILCTRKDISPELLETAQKQDMTLAYLLVRIEFSTGGGEISQLIDEALAGKINTDNSKQNSVCKEERS